MSVNQFRGQNYSSLKRECLKKGVLFTDPEFPPSNKSLATSQTAEAIEWKRPGELCKVPKLAVEGVSCDYLSEGKIGAPWLVSACSALFKDSKLWSKVLPNIKEQEKDPQGLYYFRFWRQGSWVEVVIDDLLPSRNGTLLGCHCRHRNEFWPALLEKAYAKFYGDYETMGKNATLDALVDLSGGVAEKIDIKNFPLETPEGLNNLFTNLQECHERRDLMVCFKQGSAEETEKELEVGLVQGHGYVVTGVIDLGDSKQQKESSSDGARLIRLQNPWGKREWTGAWSDNSSEWNALSPKEKDRLGIKFQQEGEFWISVEDFAMHFDTVDTCHFYQSVGKQKWYGVCFHGNWTIGDPQTAKDRAGGGPDNNTHLMNPQYVFDITGENDECVISLEQYDTAAGLKQAEAKLSEIGFQIVKVETNRAYRRHIEADVMDTSEFQPKRSIFRKVTLSRGRYVVIPCTLKPGEVSSFMLRMFTPSASKARELVQECPGPGPCMGKVPIIVSRITIIRAEGLEQLPQMNIFVTVKCEGETVKSHSIAETESPEWNFKAIFYRKKPGNPIEIQVQSSKKVGCDFLGTTVLADIGTEDGKTAELSLYGKPKKGQTVVVPGKLHIQIASSNDLTAY